MLNSTSNVRFYILIIFNVGQMRLNKLIQTYTARDRSADYSKICKADFPENFDALANILQRIFVNAIISARTDDHLYGFNSFSAVRQNFY